MIQIAAVHARKIGNVIDMLNICIVFAQLERETIQKRVTDAYYSRSQRGFKMGPHQFLKLRTVCVLAAVPFVCVFLAVTAFQLVFAKFNLAFNGNAELEQQLYEVFRKYADKRESEEAGT